MWETRSELRDTPQIRPQYHRAKLFREEGPGWSRAPRTPTRATSFDRELTSTSTRREVLMPTARSLIAGLALALTATACSDKTTTAPSSPGDNQSTEPQQQKARQPLIFPANQALTGANGTVYTLTSIRVTHFNYAGPNQLT